MDNQQLLNEIWKDIPGYQGYYQISSLGKVKSLKRLVNSSKSAIGLRIVGERILKTRIDKYGYETVILRKNNKDKHYTIHRLVASVFLDNPDNLPSINHKDLNKLNNYYLNLEWCSTDYNNKYAGRQDLINAILRNKVFGNPQIKQINLETNEALVFKSLHEASKATGYSRQEISRCCRKLRGPYKNCCWEFINSSTTIPKGSTLKQVET